MAVSGQLVPQDGQNTRSLVPFHGENLLTLRSESGEYSVRYPIAIARKPYRRRRCFTHITYTYDFGATHVEATALLLRGLSRTLQIPLLNLAAMVLYARPRLHLRNSV
jgi:hypothetical protein